MKEAGCGAGVNPSHVDLVAALAEGVAPEVLADTVREGIAAGKTSPFRWAIAVARGRHKTGAAPPPRRSARAAEPPRSGSHKQYVPETRPRRDPSAGAPQEFSVIASKLGITE
jgi:hypothetical protein